MTEVTCSFCGGVFLRRRSVGSQNLYCGKSCGWKAAAKKKLQKLGEARPKTGICASCKQIFTPSKHNWSSQKYCSDACRQKFLGENRNLEMMRSCERCGGTYRARTYHQRFCSRVCHGRVLPIPPVWDICRTCGRFFHPSRTWNTYCSPNCRKSRVTVRENTRPFGAANRERRNQQQRDRLAKQSPFRKRIPFFNHRYSASITEQDLRVIMDQQEFRCVLCGGQLSEGGGWDIDHVVPVALGGESTVSNLEILCRLCNRGKWSSTNDQYVEHCKQVVLFSERDASRRAIGLRP